MGQLWGIGDATHLRTQRQDVAHPTPPTGESNPAAASRTGGWTPVAGVLKGESARVPTAISLTGG